jgi:hypothetical protein
VARDSRRSDAGKKINGRKRHIAVDTTGLLLTVLITAAGIQDRDAARPLPWNMRRAFPAVKLSWADGGYAGKLVTLLRRLAVASAVSPLCNSMSDYERLAGAL